MPDWNTDWEAFSAQYAATEKRQLSQLVDSINTKELCSRASSLRDNLACTVELSHRALAAMMGGQHCHAEITFDDGVEWLARLRLKRTYIPPIDAADYILQSEVATLAFLQQHTRIPVPKVFGWALENDPKNYTGTAYILMEKLGGKPVNWNELNNQQKDKVMKQLMKISLELHLHPFDRLGSLAMMPTPKSDCGQSHFIVQGVAHHNAFNNQGQPLGPFEPPNQAASAITKNYLHKILNGEIAVKRLVDVYLAHRSRLELIGKLWSTSSSQPTTDPPGKGFYLKHPDDKGDHILVNESFEITGIIDWQWAQLVSEEDAFSSPCMMWPIGPFYAGSNELSDDEVRFARLFQEEGREDLAELLLKSRRVQRFFFSLRPDIAAHVDRNDFSCLFKGLQQAFSMDYDGWDQWKARVLSEHGNDPNIDLLLEAEKDTI